MSKSCKICIWGIRTVYRCNFIGAGNDTFSKNRTLLFNRGGGAELKLPIQEENVAHGIADMPTTCTSAPDVATSLMARCWSAVTDVLLSIWQLVVGITTRAWYGTVVHKGTIAEKLRDFAESVKEFNRCFKTPGEGDLEVASSLMRAAYDSLSDCLKQEISKQVQGVAEITDVGALDIVFVNKIKDINLELLVARIYTNLPSVRLGNLKEELARAADDSERVGVLLKMRDIKISDFEPDLTEDVLDEHMRVLFDGLHDSLKKTIYKEIRLRGLLSTPYGSFDNKIDPTIEIDGRVISLLSFNSGSVIFRHSPRGYMVEEGLMQVQLQQIWNSNFLSYI